MGKADHNNISSEPPQNPRSSNIIIFKTTKNTKFSQTIFKFVKQNDVLQISISMSEKGENFEVARTRE